MISNSSSHSGWKLLAGSGPAELRLASVRCGHLRLSRREGGRHAAKAGRLAGGGLVGPSLAGSPLQRIRLAGIRQLRALLPRTGVGLTGGRRRGVGLFRLLRWLVALGHGHSLAARPERTLKPALELCEGSGVLPEALRDLLRGHVVDPHGLAGLGARELARLPNVSCKISGVITEADHAHWTKEEVKPYVAHAIECFGFDRSMYGSDWTVSELTHEYPTWVAILDEVVAGASAEEQRRLWRDNAIRIYRLPA